MSCRLAACSVAIKQTFQGVDFGVGVTVSPADQRSSANCSVQQPRCMLQAVCWHVDANSYFWSLSLRRAAFTTRLLVAASIGAELSAPFTLHSPSSSSAYCICWFVDFVFLFHLLCKCFCVTCFVSAVAQGQALRLNVWSTTTIFWQLAPW